MITSGRVNFHDDLKDLIVPIDRVLPHPDNPRNGDIEAIAESIEVNGFISPVIAQRSTSRILAGNHRYHALHALHSEVIPVVWVDVDDDQARRFLLADNRTSDLGTYDNGLLADLLAQIEDTVGLQGSGYDGEDLEQLKALAEAEPDYTDVASWPTLILTVPPHLRDAFFSMTSHADNDKDRLESLLIRAGWKD